MIMTEKEKCALGLLYDPDDKELGAERCLCRDLCFAYNHTSPSQLERLRDMMRQLLGKTGDAFKIHVPFWCDYGYNIEVGENFFAHHNLMILDAAKVRFGDNVFIAPDCGFYTSGHPFDAERRNQGLEYAWPITVGDNVWIGAGVRVVPGVTIGSDVVIGAGSVVTRDIPDHVVAAGNPCRVLREITDADRNREYIWEPAIEAVRSNGSGRKA